MNGADWAVLVAIVVTRARDDALVYLRVGRAGAAGHAGWEEHGEWE